MGGSYGGYATLAGLAFTPEVFCCGVDIVGPSNLETLLATIPPYWAAFFENLARRVGDPRTEAGRKLLQERSPLNRAGAIARPLLIGQGANDPRVKQAESDQIIAAMRAKGLPVTYVLYPEEGHGFAEPANRISFYAIAEAFLAAHLGGRAEPFGGDFAGAKFEVGEGVHARAGSRRRRWPRAPERRIVLATGAVARRHSEGAKWRSSSHCHCAAIRLWRHMQRLSANLRGRGRHGASVREEGGAPWTQNVARASAVTVLAAGLGVGGARSCPQLPAARPAGQDRHRRRQPPVLRPRQAVSGGAAQVRRAGRGPAHHPRQGQGGQEHPATSRGSPDAARADRRRVRDHGGAS